MKAVLEYCHGPLRGEMGRSLLEIGQGSTTTTISAWLPNRLRTDTTEAVEILLGDTGWRCARNEPPVRLEDSGLDNMMRMRELVRGLLLIPLYEMRSAMWSGQDILLDLGGGEPWRLTLREGTPLPARLRGGGVDVEFEEFLELSVTRLPSRARLSDLGEVDVRIRETGIFFSELYFADPETVPGVKDPGNQARPLGSFSLGGDYRPATPEVLEIPAALWLVLDDPESWEKRHELVLQSHFALFEQGQFPAGFTGFIEENGRQLMIIPFLPDPERGSRPFVRRQDQTVRRVPEHKALVVYPGPGRLQEAIETGRETLDDHALRNELQARGPVRAYPYLDLSQGAPTTEDLANVEVRLELPIR